ncbi:hypothetical protein VTO42DRAFT_2620 [Malbranchea cinnamomea]
MSVDDIPAVHFYRKVVQDLLEKAAEVKESPTIEPPLTEAELGDSIRDILQSRDDTTDNLAQSHFAAVEAAFREKFYELVATTSIESPTFTQVWNLLDIVSIFSDNERCEPGLIFWLIEELLDSQTIDGCRRVFDYLESRRERNTAKHFKQKSLIILRSCNELLRRLSRAEDIVFCGRVFIFLFQSFPLGDKSSVNLRGEYHTENVTTFDDLQKASPGSGDAMDIDVQEKNEAPGAADQQQVAEGESGNVSQPSASERPSLKKLEKSKELDMDALYPIFWGLQAYFSAPTKLFDTDNFAAFKSGIETTLASFRKVSEELEVRGMSKGLEETRRGVKRKRNGDPTDVTNNFNPKYLTSRDLFELEVNDVAFRRHILVQALILLNFLLSLTPKAKAKLSDATNKSVLYGYVLSDEDARWVVQTKAAIASYLQQGIDGKFYYRMVDTVLTRDKNWVRWKADGCPPIEKPAVSIQDYLDTRLNAAKITANKRLRVTPLGSFDLTFLTEDPTVSDLNRLKEPERFTTPTPDSYMPGILDDEFNIDMAQTSEEKEESMKAKASKMWRTLRLAARTKLHLLDKIEDGKNLKVLFEGPASQTPAQPHMSADNTTKNRTSDETNGAH